jgi:hypothetical protein
MGHAIAQRAVSAVAAPGPVSLAQREFIEIKTRYAPVLDALAWLDFGQMTADGYRDFFCLKEVAELKFKIGDKLALNRLQASAKAEQGIH